MTKYLLRLFISVALLLGLNSCGYKPSSKFSRSVTGEKISTSVHISLVDPENTVLIKDAVDAAIVSTFHASLVERAYSDTHLEIKMSSPSYTPIQYNSDGYVIAYRARVTLNIIRHTKGEKRSYNTHGSYDFSVEPNAIITDQERFNAIKSSASKAINAFIAKLSAEGSLKK
ncbi:MAG: LPS assembly lipoprotein LptE [Sulfurimonas sp.]